MVSASERPQWAQAPKSSQCPAIEVRQWAGKHGGAWMYSAPPIGRVAQLRWAFEVANRTSPPAMIVDAIARSLHILPVYSYSELVYWAIGVAPE